MPTGCVNGHTVAAELLWYGYTRGSWEIGYYDIWTSQYTGQHPAGLDM